MSLQYSDEEINDFILTLQRDVRRSVSKTQTIFPMGFALGRVDPKGVRRRSAHIMYARPVRSYTRFLTFSEYVRGMALRAEAECAGCVVKMPASLNESTVSETIMIHAEQLLGGHRCWHAGVQVVDGETQVTDFEELIVNPHPDYPNFLPVEMYGAMTVFA